MDRAGLVGSDGETHQGIFDLTFLSSVPNMSVMAPKNRWELEKMLQFAISYDGPIAIRYPRGEAYRGLKEFLAPVEYGVSEMLYEERGTALRWERRLSIWSATTGWHSVCRMKKR